MWFKISDGKLPEDKKEVLVYTKFGSYHIAFYNPVTNGFYYDFDTSGKDMLNNIIAWSYLPKYIEK